MGIYYLNDKAIWSKFAMTHTKLKRAIIDLTVPVIMVKNIVQENTNVFLSSDIASNIVFDFFKYLIDTKCYWTGKKYEMFSDEDFVNLLLNNGVTNLNIDKLDKLISDLTEVCSDLEESMNEYFPIRTWDVWRYNRVDDYAVEIICEGDYRILEWANYQIYNNTSYGKMYSRSILHED